MTYKTIPNYAIGVHCVVFIPTDEAVSCTLDLQRTTFYKDQSPNYGYSTIDNIGFVMFMRSSHRSIIDARRCHSNTCAAVLRAIQVSGTSASRKYHNLQPSVLGMIQLR